MKWNEIFIQQFIYQYTKPSYRTWWHSFSVSLNRILVLLSWYLLSTDCPCYLLLSDLLKNSVSYCVRIGDDCFLSPPAAPSNSAITIWGGISTLDHGLFTPVVDVTVRGQDQDGSGNLLSRFLPSLIWELIKTDKFSGKVAAGNREGMSTVQLLQMSAARTDRFSRTHFTTYSTVL